jgi:hypothetical protein
MHPSSSSDYGAVDNQEEDSLEVCSIEVLDFRHPLCAACMLALCCHIKPITFTIMLQPPTYHNCISRLVVADSRRPRPRL